MADGEKSKASHYKQLVCVVLSIQGLEQTALAQSEDCMITMNLRRQYLPLQKVDVVLQLQLGQHEAGSKPSIFEKETPKQPFASRTSMQLVEKPNQQFKMEGETALAGFCG